VRLASELATTGRLSRSGFWLRLLFAVPLAYWVVIAVSDTVLAVPAALLICVLLVSLWGRRLHDRGRSAWWLLVMAVPVLGPLLLFIECGLRGSVPAGTRFESSEVIKTDYFAIGTPRS